MLSISEAKKAGGAVSYFSDHLVQEGAVNATEDYYTSGEAGQWIGQGAEALGLVGEVKAEDFGRALLAVDQDGEALVSNGGSEERRAGWDLTFSADKSISTLWAAGDDALKDAIEKAHADAVDIAMEFLQSDGGIAGRRGKGGHELENSKLVAANFNHGTSREQDPQLHTHTFVMNLAQRSDKSWGAIQSYEIMKRKMATGAIYRAHLASEMQKLGFGIEQKPKGLFEVKDVNPDLQKSWSKRRSQVKAAMSERGGISAKSAEAAALSTRSKKEEVDQEQLTSSWKEQAASFGVTAESINSLREKEQEPIKMQSIEDIWRELTTQESTLSEHKLAAKIYEKSAGALNADEAQSFLRDFIRDDQTITLRDPKGRRHYTSREMYELEQSLAANALARQNESHALPEGTINKVLTAYPTISDEQRDMVLHVTSNEGVSVVEGMAGTGKTFALAVAHQSWQAEGYNVIGAALSGKAAEGLEEGADIKSQTLHSLLMQLNKDPETGLPAKRRLNDRDIIVLDEAGMVGSRQMSNLLGLAEEAGAKVVLVGDSKQLQPIDAGGSFRSLSKALGAAELKDIRRQNSSWHKEAVTAFSEGEAGLALAEFESRGLIQTGKDHDETILKMVDKWHLDSVESGDTSLSNSMMLSGTRADTAKLNSVAREVIKDRLEGDIAEINGFEFQRNDRVIFTENNKKLNVKNGTKGTVLFAEKGTNLITVKIDGTDRLATINPDDYDAIQHGYAMTVHKSQGATTDRAYVLVNEYMAGQEWSYVAMSRSRDDTVLFCDEELREELHQTMSKESAKFTSTDFEIEM